MTTEPQIIPRDERGRVWHPSKRVTVEHTRLGWVVGVEWLTGHLYLSFGRYIVVIHRAKS